MPIVGLRTDGGKEIRFTDIDPIRDAELFGVSPATLLFLKNEGSRRSNTGEISASQWGRGLRQMWLERTKEVFTGAHDSIAAMMGTAKHAHVLTDGIEKGDVITELRLFDSTGRISGQADQIAWMGPKAAAIYDQKTGKKYSLKMFRAEQATHHYTFQLNLLADLFRENNPGVEVVKLAIEWMPSDAGRGDPKLEIVDVPMWEHGRALVEYQRVLGELTGFLHLELAPPLCSPEDRWERFDKKTGKTTNIRCVEYCPYLAACKAESAKRDEVHPVDMEG